MKTLLIPEIESLEQRKLLSTSFVGTDQADAITIFDKPNDPSTVVVRITTNGVTTRATFAAAGVDGGVLDIAGRGGNDTITVDQSKGVIPVQLVLRGNGGADTIVDGSGNDTLLGGADDDNLRGGSGDDSLNGGGGADMLSGNSGNDSITGATGNDTVMGAAGNDTMDGGIGDDSMNGGGGDDSMHGNEGNDSLVGGIGTNELWGDAGQNHGMASEEGEWQDANPEDGFDL